MLSLMPAISSSALLNYKAVKIGLWSMGIIFTSECINEFGRWVGSFIPGSRTGEKAHGAAMEALKNTSLAVPRPKISGLWSALRNCPPPFTEGSLSCYQEGWSNNPIGRTVDIVTAPIRFSFNSAHCFTTEKGMVNKVACMAGLDEAGKQVLEEKTQIAALFVLLFMIWYKTLPEEENNKKERVQKT